MRTVQLAHSPLFQDAVVRPLSCILREQARVVHLPRLAKQAGHAEGYAAAGRWEHAETSVGSVLALRSICINYVTLDSPLSRQGTIRCSGGRDGYLDPMT